MKRMRWLALSVVLVLGAQLTAHAGPQNDGGSGGDAGNTFEAATSIQPLGRYAGVLERSKGDADDFFKFTMAEGAFVSVLVTVAASGNEPVTLLDPDGNVVDVGVRASGGSFSHSAVFTTEATVIRLAVHKALVAGDYRLHLTSANPSAWSYSLCFMNCEQPQSAGIDMIFGGSLRHADTSVLLVPPMHGDLGDPNGPTVLEYIEATLRGVHGWTAAMDAFATKYPQFAYLRQITVDIEIFDEAKPVDPAGYDVVIGYVAAGPAFRGVASSGVVDPQTTLDRFGDIHYSGRTILLSLFGSSPRAGQVTYDFPEVNDLEIVTFHEFGHTFGLGHTTTWHPTLGPDLMNSPATFIYGNGFALGDGGERTPIKCLSSLDLWGMAYLYRWLPSGVYQSSGGRRSPPSSITYEMVC